MLKVVGAGTLDELYSSIPLDCRRTDALRLPEPMTEWELNDHMAALAGNMAIAPDHKVFVGAAATNILSRNRSFNCFRDPNS